MDNAEFTTCPASWRQSSVCVPDDLCVEVWHQDHVVRLRDSKDQEGPELRFRSRSWQTFLATVATESDLGSTLQLS